MQTSSQSIEGNGAAQSGDVLLRQVTLSRARELAKTADYEAALVLLLQMEPTAAALDLRARIEVQRGRYDDARALWKEVLELTPDHAGAKKGLRDVDRADLLKKVSRGFALGAVLLAAGGAAFIALRPSAEEPVQPAVAAQPAPRAQPLAAAKPELQPAVKPAAMPATKPLAAAAGPQPAAASTVAPKAALPKITLPEGVSLRLEGGAQLYSFDGGLFSEGVAFVPGGRERVTALGRALAPYADSVKLELIGHVDTVPTPVEKQFHGTTELALSRANAVLGRLARTTRIPADAVALRAVGGRLGPFSDAQGDPRNRTVQIRVTPRD